MSTPNLSPEAEIVLEAISEVKETLVETQEGMVSMKEELAGDSRSRFRLGMTILAVTVLIWTLGFVGYAQYDRVTRCHSRADTIQTIKRVIAEDHNALPEGLLKGFGDTEDVKQVVAVIRSSYDDSEARIDVLLPEPDCSGFLP